MRRPKYGQPPPDKALSIHLGHIWRDLRWSATFCTRLHWPYQPKPSLRAPKLRPASGACLDRHMGVWCRKEAKPLLQRPPSISQGHRQRILKGRGCLHVPDVRPPPHNGGQAHLDSGQKLPLLSPIILYETAKIRTTTIAEGIVHPFGTCIEGFEAVCNVLHTSMLAIPAQTQLQSPRNKTSEA